MFDVAVRAPKIGSRLLEMELIPLVVRVKKLQASTVTMLFGERWRIVNVDLGRHSRPFDNTSGNPKPYAAAAIKNQEIACQRGRIAISHNVPVGRSERIIEDFFY
jgi:hypothetical protein